ncbi:MAG TPA: TIGR02221 family CRISPR-associated protein [Syntrophomonadaceae bacterium]|nr:TIGR02221 family CRISPR-associated protein [Syntrophomonadaceae bacterium]
MLVALSSVVPTDYKVGDYFWLSERGEQQVCRTDLFPLAVDAFFHPDKLLLIVTEDARSHKNYERIEKAFGERLQPVMVPLGKNEDELWQIFELVADSVPSDSRVILDVTHALRSLPFIVFGVINYLRLTKGVALERIVYGAYDVRDNSAGDVPSVPVFDLTMMMELQEWMLGVEDFQNRCEGERLAELLEEAQGRPWRAAQGRRNELPRQLKEMGECIRDFSRSMRLLRPLDALASGSRALIRAKNIEQEAVRWAKPFKHILSRVTEELTPLAVSDVSTLDEKLLKAQLSLIDYFIEKGLIVQAALMEREWVINWLAWCMGLEKWRSKRERKNIEDALGLAVLVFCRKERGMDSLPEWYKQLPEAEDLAHLWNDLTNFRNDVAHCAMNENPESPETIIRKAKEKVKKLWKLLP